VTDTPQPSSARTIRDNVIAGVLLAAILGALTWAWGVRTRAWLGLRGVIAAVSARVLEWATYPVRVPAWVFVAVVLLAWLFGRALWRYLVNLAVDEAFRREAVPATTLATSAPEPLSSPSSPALVARPAAPSSPPRTEWPAFDPQENAKAVGRVIDSVNALAAAAKAINDDLPMLEERTLEVFGDGQGARPAYMIAATLEMNRVLVDHSVAELVRRRFLKREPELDDGFELFDLTKMGRQRLIDRGVVRLPPDGWPT
jgi:hypothetical protein